MYNKQDGHPRWKTIETGPTWQKQEGWFRGKRIYRFLNYGTLQNTHKPSRWRISGYEARGKPFASFKEALVFAQKV